MSKKTQDLLVIALVTIFSTLLLWLPFIAGWESFLGFKIPNQGTKTLWANYDGPNYLVIAKTWYDKQEIGRNFSLPLPLEYYPAHFPGFPLLITTFSLLLSPPWAMLTATLLTAVIAAITFYLFLKTFSLSKNPLWLTIIFLFLPARILAVRSVGAPEMLFIGSILASIYFFRQNKFFLAGITGAIAQLTKTPGILLFVCFGVMLLVEALPQLKQKKYKLLLKTLPKAWPLLLIPLSALGVFFFYQARTGNFWAYFASGDNFHLYAFPYQTFNAAKSWLGQIWLEDLIWLYFLEIIGITLLFKRGEKELATYGAIFLLVTFFVAHRDLTRYSLPVWPFVLMGFDPYLQRKEVKTAFYLILPAIYLFSLNFILGNTAPVQDWAPYL